MTFFFLKTATVTLDYPLATSFCVGRGGGGGGGGVGGNK